MKIAMFSALILAPNGLLAQAELDPFFGEALPQHLEWRVEQQSSDLLVSFIDNFQYAFLDGLKLWDNSRPIRVCFFGGNQDLRLQIVNAAANWTSVGGKVPLDFGPADDPPDCELPERFEIRIGFDYKGYWSMVGTDSINLAGQGEQSMNFGLFDVNPPPEPLFTRYVLHEFGHALGFNHEHQSPNAKCAQEFNWDVIYEELQGPPNEWSVSKIDKNLRPLELTQPAVSVFDSHSIMLYTFPARFYKNLNAADCFSTGNNSLSDFDKAAIAQLYPTDSIQSTSVRENAVASYSSALGTLDVPLLDKSMAQVWASQLGQTLSGVDSMDRASIDRLTDQIMMQDF